MVANRGLPEAEILRDGQGRIALTILRAVGWLSREDLLARTSGAGPEIPTPDAQSLGHNRASYSIIPFAGDWLTSHAYQIAEEYLAPLYGSATGAHAGDLPRDGGLIQLGGPHTLVLSTCKKAERSDDLILRFWNVAQEPTEARVHLARTPSQVRPVDLQERPLSDELIPIEGGGSFILRAGPARIVTVAISFSQLERDGRV
jgi:mannosylglycerate hydrolase